MMKRHKKPRWRFALLYSDVNNKGYSGIMDFYDAVDTLEAGSHLLESCKGQVKLLLQQLCDQ